jgi:outer membrane protein OmpA-like peptidoglycan-associated protein
MSERQAAAERAQREEAERRSVALQQQLAAEQANRQAQSAEVERLRQQIDENRRAAQAQIEADRQARLTAERQLEEAYGKYTTSITTSAPSDVDAMRRQIEDQQLTLRTIQDRERANAEAMQSEIARLRNDLTAAQQSGNLSADVIAQRQADILARQQQLDTLRQSLETEAAARAQRDKQEQEAIAAAQARRQQADAEAAALRQQAENAAQQAQAAQAAAQQANAQAQQAQAAAQSAQSQLEETRRQLAQSDAETRRLRIQNELARIASTRCEQRGLIVTLNGGILFDTGKTALKPGAKSTLSRIAKQLQTDPSLKIAVEGHTDNVGSTATNQTLSEKRANAVRDYLVSAGISSDHITADGKGEESPIATNKTVAGRQQNRRVELVITQ